MKKLLYVLLLSAIFTVGLFSINKNIANAENKDAMLSVNEIEENVNELIIKEKKEFDISSDDFELSKVRELYGLDDDVIAFYYNILENGSIKGYVLASANPNLDSILEYGQLIDNTDDYYGEILHSNNNLNAYYLGYQAIFFDTDANSLNAQLEEKKESAIETVAADDKELAEQIRNLDLGLDENISVEKENNPQLFAVDPNVEVMTLPMRRLSQRADGVANKNSACGATTGAMITNYFKEERGYNVRGYKTYGSNSVPLINHLYFDMNTTPLGANAYSFGKGLQLHLNHDMSGWLIGSNAEPTFASVKSSIKSKFPVAMLNLASLVDNYYHWRVINGYNSDTTKIAILDPDGSNATNQWISWTSVKNNINTVTLKR